MVNVEIIEKLQWMTCDKQEICGVILTSGEIETIIPIKNVANSPDNFIFDKKEWFTLLNKIKQSGEQIRAIYHSHRGDVDPSPQDLNCQRNLKMDFIIISASDWRYIKYA